jgi:hypothetical protein
MPGQAVQRRKTAFALGEIPSVPQKDPLQRRGVERGQCVGGQCVDMIPIPLGFSSENKKNVIRNLTFRSDSFAAIGMLSGPFDLDIGEQD